MPRDHAMEVAVTFNYPAPEGHIWGPEVFASQIGTEIRFNGYDVVLEKAEVASDGKSAMLSVSGLPSEALKYINPPGP